MNRTLNSETVKHIDDVVNVKGWVQTRRDHGKIIFLDMRDRSGLLQVVIFNAELIDKITKAGVTREFVLEISGKIAKRPDKLVNNKIPSGTVELQAESVEVISTAETPPFEIEDELTIEEELRMKYRYLDLRRPAMLNRFKLRSKVLQFIRNWLVEKEFIEVDTPILTKDTPEGAREYIVPSRLQPGKGYALPQSPQQFKQLLMASGFEKYFQIAKCLRDEDPRGDRQPEFTQLDMEMSFVGQKDVMQLNEALLIDLIETLAPDKHIQTKPFPRMTYAEAMEKYKTDRPDLRVNKEDPNELAFCWIIDFPFFEKADNGNWTFTHNPFSAPTPECMEDLMNKKDIPNIKTTQYDIVMNGYEIGGGSIRNHNPKALQKVFEIMGLSDELIEKKFGHMLKAFSYGTPTHGGIAWGFDRLMMLLTDTPNIREVIAFPKTGDGRDLMMGAPSEITADKLKELHLKRS